MSNSEHARDKFRSKTNPHAASRLFGKNVKDKAINELINWGE